MLIHILLAVTADPLGRFDACALSDQQMMELLVQDMPHEKFQDENGEFLDISKWGRVTLNADGSVEKALFAKKKSGSIAFEYLPRRMTEFRVIDSALTGTLDTQALPQTLQTLLLMKDQFDGEVHWTELPPLLIKFNVAANQFYGSVDLTHLPQHMETFSVQKNQFSAGVLIWGEILTLG